MLYKVIISYKEGKILKGLDPITVLLVGVLMFSIGKNVWMVYQAVTGNSLDKYDGEIWVDMILSQKRKIWVYIDHFWAFFWFVMVLRDRDLTSAVIFSMNCLLCWSYWLLVLYKKSTERK